MGSYPRALADPARDLYGERAALRRADLPVLHRADRQRLAPRLRGPGRRRRLRGDQVMGNGSIILHHDGAVPGVRLHGRAGRVRPDGGRARRLHAHADQHAVDDRTDVPRHRLRDPARGAVLPAGRRADDLGRRDQPHDPAGADHGRPSARRARAGRHAVQHVLRRHFRLVHRRRRGAQPHRRGGDDQGRLRPRLHGGADRLRLHDGEPDSAEHHGGGLRRDRQRLDRRAVSRRHRAGRADRHRADDLLALLRAGRDSQAAREPVRIRRRGARVRSAADDPAHHHGRHPDRLVHADRGRHDRVGLHPRGADPAAQSQARPQSAARLRLYRAALFAAAGAGRRRVGVRLDARLSARARTSSPAGSSWSPATTAASSCCCWCCCSS